MPKNEILKIKTHTHTNSHTIGSERQLQKKKDKKEGNIIKWDNKKENGERGTIRKKVEEGGQ